MELTSKEIRKVHTMVKAAYKKLKEAEDFLVAYEKNPFRMTAYPNVYITTSNIFKIQDVLGGQLRMEPFINYKDVYDVMLEVDGVKYIQAGLTQEEINARKSNLDYTF
jgi:hypothetical protein